MPATEVTAVAQGSVDKFASTTSNGETENEGSNYRKKILCDRSLKATCEESMKAVTSATLGKVNCPGNVETR
jgi:hypothetical protein